VSGFSAEIAVDFTTPQLYSTYPLLAEPIGSGDDPVSKGEARLVVLASRRIGYLTQDA
jgi:hypothetical protein